jgi:hypothetical protein
MTSFLDRDGEVSIRLDVADRATFIKQYGSRTSVQYGRQMKEFVVVPADLLERQEELRPWFVRSWEWVGTLRPM